MDVNKTEPDGVWWYMRINIAYVLSMLLIASIAAAGIVVVGLTMLYVTLVVAAGAIPLALFMLVVLVSPHEYEAD